MPPKKLARIQSKNITMGVSRSRFIGPKSAEVIIQEIWALKNIKPAFRKSDYNGRLGHLKAKLRSMYGTSYSDELWRQIFK